MTQGPAARALAAKAMAPSARKQRTAPKPAGTAWIGVASVTAMLAFWWGLTAFRIVRPDLLPSPLDVLTAFREVTTQGYRGTTLTGNILSTLGRLAGGFGLAVVVGVPLGLWMGMNRYAAAALDWIVQFMRPLPPLSYMILLILWLGVGDLSKSALLFLTAFPIVVAASAAGVAQVRRQRIQVALSLGANAHQVFRHVVLPSAAPMILTGLQIALAAAFSTVVSAELMAATDGLGWMVISASQFLRNDIILLCILILGFLGIGLAWALRVLDRRLVHWRGRDL
jgi:taurine transport system permease protein